MKKIVFIAFGSSMIATTAIAEPRITTAPAVQSMVQQVQHYGWPDRPGGPGPVWSGCNSVQQICAQRWIPGGHRYNRCMALRGC